MTAPELQLSFVMTGPWAPVQGYALVEFETKEEAERAIKELDGVELLEQTLKLDWAFVKRK